MKRIAIIADDLTGALDTASPFACNGARTFCFTSPDAVNAEPLQEANVISVTTNSRHLAPGDAQAAAERAALRLSAWRPDVVLKKVDSRLKGNIAVECKAMAGVFGRNCLIVAPAAPDIGRFVEGGAVVGHGVDQPINVQERFAQFALPIEVPEATSRDQMNSIAKQVLSNRNCLPVCSRGLAQALVDIEYPSTKGEVTNLERPILVGIGSRDPVTAAQVEGLCSAGGFACFTAPRGNVPDLVDTHDHLLIHCSGDVMQNATEVAHCFAMGLKRVIDNFRPRTIMVSGGDTAFAVLEALGKTVLQVEGEIAAGLPISSMHLDGRMTYLISKSGGFGNPQTLLDVFRDNLSDT
jgi:uncharacterized protein YgbK (DUF1537 family)